MTKVLLLIFILFYSTACHFQPRQADCSKFRAGEFYLVNKKLGHKYRVLRNDVTQQEIDDKAGTTTTMKIKWITPCEYELAFLSAKGPGSDTMTSMPEARVVRTRITAVGDNYYVFETKAPGIDLIYSDTMRVIKTR